MYAKIGVEDDASRILFSAFADIPSKGDESVRRLLFRSLSATTSYLQGMVMETYYLCRVPRHDLVVLFKERDYEYQRLHERQLRVPDPDYDVVLLAKGTKEQMQRFYKLTQEPNNVSQVSNDRME